MPPTLIALEGIDGSGKGTAAAMLVKRLAARGVRAEVVSFPRYGETQAAKLIAAMLNGEFKPPSAIYAATLFALDRAEWMKRPPLDVDMIVFDRYVMSNIAFQTARAAPEERAALADWLVDLEFTRLGTPPPRLNILLDVPEPIAASFLLRKEARSYTNEKMDAFEADRPYQAAVRSAYLDLATRKVGGAWAVIDVAPDQRSEPLAPSAVVDAVLKAIDAR
jgi:dTMP kinase